jgi:hypothetical protein
VKRARISSSGVRALVAPMIMDSQHCEYGLPLPQWQVSVDMDILQEMFSPDFFARSSLYAQGYFTVTKAVAICPAANHIA